MGKQMKKEIKEFKHITNDLYEIAESPYFNDEMRNNAQALQYYIDTYKEEPVVMKSGGTWVAEYEGRDYICIVKTNEDDIESMDYTNLQDRTWWKPIKETKITDEIVNLNPSVITNAYHIAILLAMSKSEIFIVSDINDGEWECRTTEPMHSLKRLATVKDLRENT